MQRIELIDKLEQRLTFKVGGCWFFIGYRSSTGYGRINEERRSQLAHRIAWTVFIGPIPSGMQVLHSCDEPYCCNPKHLFLGTHDDNMADKVMKGRGANTSGENNPKALLSENEVLEIRRMLNLGFTQRFIANRFKVSRSAIAHIKVGNTWR